jgi:hypothetical protein
MDDRFRASDADRDSAVALLRVHFAAGRLTAGELDERLSAALGAKTLGDLRLVLADLPGAGDIVLLDEYHERLVGRAERASMTGPAHSDLRFGQSRQPSLRLGDSASLARSYRRLLACYPARYRRVHEDEMLAVLMTDAPPGKRRPGIAEAADLLLGALRIRCQPSRAVGGEPAWRDALAVVSVIVPLMVLLSNAASLIQVLMPPALPPGDTRGPIQWNVPALVAPLALVALVLLAVRMRRLATLGATGMLIVGTLAELQPIQTPAGPRSQTTIVVMTGAYGILMLVMEVIALSASPGPRRALQILTWKHWAFAVIATLLAGPYVVPMTPPVRVAVTVVICAAMAVASSLGRWVLLLLAGPVCPTLARILMDVGYLRLSSAGIAELYLPSLALVVLAIAAARRTSFRPS